MLEKYDGGASEDVYKIVTGDESWICAFEPETKQQSAMWAFEPEPNPTKAVCGKIASKQMVASSFCKTGHVATVPLEHLRTVNSECFTTIYLPKVFELSHIGSNQRLIDWPKRRIEGSFAV